MIEREFVRDKKKEFSIQEHVSRELLNVGHSRTELVKTPLGDKIIIHAARPGLVVGKKGETIKKITQGLKKNFKLENPEIEIKEVDEQMLDARIVAERIASTLERYGINRFKAVSHRVMNDVLRAGGLGIEIIISGKVPSSRAKSWRFYKGYLKKCGDFSIEGVRSAITSALMKSGQVGIKVSIMPPGLNMPDDMEVPNEVQGA